MFYCKQVGYHMGTKFVGPIHFEDFFGEQFERLVFAYFLRTHNWKSLEWNGQRGKDGGRDIIGVIEKDGSTNQNEKLLLEKSNLI